MNLNTLRGIASVVIVFTLVDGALHVLGFPYSFTGTGVPESVLTLI